MPMHGGGCQWLGVRIVEQTVDEWRRVMVMVVFGWWYLDGRVSGRACNLFVNIC